MRLSLRPLLAGLLLATPAAYAQPAAQSPAPAAPAKTLLWEVSGKGLARPSYVFGTIHLQCAADVRLSPAAQQALAATQQVTLELDMDDPALPQQMQAQMLLPAGQQLQTCLTPAEYAAVSDYVTTQLKLPMAQLGGVKPVLLTALLMQKLLACPLGGYELTLVEWAKKNQHEVTGLETVAEQMAVLDQVPCAVQAHLLAAMIAQPAQSTQELHQLLSTYQQQDPEALYRLTLDSKFGMPQCEAQLLTARNTRWVPLIARQAATKPTFFAVGAAHLGGPSGVLTQLRQQGYQVKPVL